MHTHIHAYGHNDWQGREWHAYGMAYLHVYTSHHMHTYTQWGSHTLIHTYTRTRIHTYIQTYTHTWPYAITRATGGAQRVALVKGIGTWCVTRWLAHVVVTPCYHTLDVTICVGTLYGATTPHNTLLLTRCCNTLVSHVVVTRWRHTLSHIVSHCVVTRANIIAAYAQQ